MKKLFAYLLFSMLLSVACSQHKETRERAVGGPCDGCGQMFEAMPASFSWQTKISSASEPGEPLTIQGTIFKADGKTPAPDIIFYVYHTDRNGLYSPSPGQTAGKRHGHLRGWMKTDASGRYEFSTIRPAAYPNRTAPQHIHVLVKEPTTSLYWIDEYLFDDDPLLTANERIKQEKRGGPGIIHLTKNTRGEWTGRRDIILGMNIPDY